jgi:hypothetical protein
MHDERQRVKQWLAGQRAAAEVQLELLAQEGPRVERAVAQSIAALEALRAMGRWPGPRDPESERAVKEVRARWARVQRHARKAAL